MYSRTIFSTQISYSKEDYKMRRDYVVTRDNMDVVLEAIQSITNKYSMYKIEESTIISMGEIDELVDCARTGKSTFIYSEIITNGETKYIRMVGSVSLGNGYTIIKPGSRVSISKSRIDVQTTQIYHNKQDIDNPMYEICFTTFKRNPFKKIKNLEGCVNMRIHELQKLDIRFKNFEADGVAWKEE